MAFALCRDFLPYAYMSKYIRFDWAVKRLLRQKANFVVLEGFLSTLLGTKIKIRKMLESESNQEHENDKFNRVDMFAEFENGELAIIEVQNNRELDYFHRILFGVSKAITENIELGEDYIHVKKVYSVNIVYFGLGQGEDYIYKGRTDFVGLNNPNDVLKLTKKQQEQFCSVFAGDIFPEYYILRVDDFDKTAKTPLDEWISFLKTGDIPETATAPGLPEARQKLLEDGMTAEEKLKYRSHLESLRYQRSVIKTGFTEGYDKGEEEGMEKGMEKGRQERNREIVLSMKNKGMSVGEIAAMLDLTEQEVAAYTATV